MVKNARKNPYVGNENLGEGESIGRELFLVGDEQILATLWRLALSPTNKENLSIRGLTVYLTAETTAATTAQNNFLD